MDFNPLVLKLGTRDCKEAYPNILYTDDANLNDNIMLSMMRMFLTDERLKNMSETNGRIQLQVVSSTFYSEDQTIDKDTFVHDESPFSQFQYGIMIYVMTNSNSKEILKKAEEYNPNYESQGWKKLDDVSQYVDKDGEAFVYQNPEKKGTVIFVGAKKAIHTMHMAASCLPRLLPWCFTEIPITDAEKTIVRYLYDGKEREFCDAMQEFYNAGDFYGKKIAASLKGFCSANFESTIRRQTRDIEEKEQRLRSEFDTIYRMQRELEDMRIRLAAVHNKMYCTDEDELQIVNYLKVNKALQFLGKEGDRLYIGFTGFLNDCDEAQFKYSVENKKDNRNYIFGDSPYSLEETKAFFISIWKEHRFNIRTYCEWYITSDDRVYPVTQCDMNNNDELMANRIRQPHIDRHGCFSGYEAAFAALTEDRDYVGTLTTIISSSSSLNWGDSVVVGELMRDLFKEAPNHGNKIIEDNSGNLYTVAEVFEILKKERETADKGE